MGYKQPGFGNGKKAPTVHSSPLNLLSKKKQQAARESEGTEMRSGVTVSANQYEGKTNEQIKKLKDKAAKKAAKAEEKAASGRKLSKRQQDAIAERDYNIKRDSEKAQAEEQKQKNIETYGGNYSAKARARLDQKAMEEANAENQAGEAEASANRFRDPGLVASENRDPAEASIPSLDVVGERKEPGFNYEGHKSSGVRNPEHKGPTGGDYTNQQIKDMNSENFGKYDEYNVSKHYGKGSKGWEEQYSSKKGGVEAGRKKMMEDYPKRFGKDVAFPLKEDGSPDYMAAYKALKA